MAVPLEIEQDGPGGETIQNPSGLGVGDRPGSGGRLHPERLDGQARDELGLPGGEEDLEDLAALRRHLMRTRVILVHPGLEKRLHSTFYSFHPRFIGHEEDDLLPFYQVLVRLLETAGQ